MLLRCSNPTLVPCGFAARADLLLCIVEPQWRSRAEPGGFE